MKGTEARERGSRPLASPAKALVVERPQHVVHRSTRENDAETHFGEPVTELDVLERSHLLVEATTLLDEIPFDRDSAGPEVAEVEHVAVPEAPVCQRNWPMSVTKCIRSVTRRDGSHVP